MTEGNPAALSPAVGIFSSLSGLPIENRLRAEGWQTRCLRWGEKFDSNDLRRFNVILLTEFPAVDRNISGNSDLGVFPEYEERMQRLLEEYVGQGGGLLVYGGDWPIAAKPLNAMLAGWGIQLLNETVVDPTHAFKQQTGMQFDYQFTDDIVRHPATLGVRTVFYPLRSLYGAAVNPLMFNKEWQPLVRASPDAVSRPLMVKQNFAIADGHRAGSYGTAPPIAAVRRVGNGRVAVFGWSPLQTFFDYGHYMVEDIYFTRGNGHVSSDGLILLERTLAYLAEPSQSDPALKIGGYVNQPNRRQPNIPKPILWGKSFVDDEAPDAHWYRGIIGARTALTGGSGTVAEYAAAARAAKLDFIAFMEDFSRLTKEDWNAFRAECELASGPDLLVLPGQAVQRGKAGDWYFKVSDYDWPQRDMLTRDGKRIDNYLYEHFQSGLNTLGPFDLRHEPSPFWVSRAYNSMAVATTRSGKTDYDIEPFLYMTGLQDAPQPVAVDLITSPSQVAEAASRFLNLRLCTSQEQLRRSLKNPDIGRAAEVSNGPVITTWTGNNLTRVTWGRLVPGTERFQLRLKAVSDQPLVEAIIYDGTSTFRRYRLTNAKSCDIVINALHDKQHEFVAIVRDALGHVAIRSGLTTMDLSNRRFMCGDRQDSLGSAFTVDACGYEVFISSCFQQLKFMWRNGGFPSNPQTVDRVPWYWDGAPGGYVSGGVDNGMQSSPPIATQPPGTEVSLVSRMAFPLGSRDVICQEIDTEAVMPDHPLHEGGFWPVQPLAVYRAQTRCFEFEKTPDGPAAMLVEGSYTTLEDGKFEPGKWYWNQFSHIFYKLSGTADANCNWALVDLNGAALSGPAPPRAHPANFVKMLRPGGYAAYTTAHQSGAVFALDRPIQIAQELNEDNWFRVWLGYNRLGQVFKKGDVIPYRFVVLTGSVDAPPDTRAIESFRRSFGLDGHEPAYKVAPRIGTVRSMDYVLELDSSGGGFGGVISKADLPTRLPIRVHGVNPNWTSAIAERRQKWWLPVGVLDGAAYAALDTASEHDIWIGNVVLCDQSDLVLTLLPDGEGRFAIEVHNPTNRELTATIRTVAEFNLVPPFAIRKTLPPETSEIVQIQ